LTADDVQSLFDGLETNGLIEDYTHVLTGNKIENTRQVFFFTHLLNRVYWKLRHFRKD
jgi:hypothetical protein